ncbi:MAG: tetratricopeptide repeat protein [Candidatus Omnitrophota bacterium]|nr:tetratricopeptide repeat protein [Candidatus Omnitrophota bacterium]
MKITPKTHILLIALIIVMVFSPYLKNDFSWDDKYLITNNPHIKDWSFITKIFKNQLYEGDDLHSNFYRPLQTVSFMADYSIWKMNPFGYHFTSLVLHMFNAALVYIIIYAIAFSPYMAFFTALLFGIAPAISGITFYIPARSDLLMGLFMFLSIIFFIRYRRENNKIFYVISVLAFILSLLCKEMAVALLLLLALIAYREKISYKYLSPYACVLLLYVFLRVTALNFAKGLNPVIDMSFPATVPLWSRVLTDFKVILLYIKVLLFPFDLHMEWFIKPVKNIFEPGILLSAAALIFLIIFVKRISRKNSLILFGALWFLLSLLPVLNIYPVSVFFGEGWLYLPSIGFFIMICVIFNDMVKPMIGKLLSGILAASFFIYFGFFTMSYGKVWKDSISLFNNVLKYEKNSPFIHFTYTNLGVAYYDKGDFEKAIECYKKSIQSEPEYFEPYNNLAVTYVIIKRPVAAISFFKKTIRLKKDYTPAYYNLGHVYDIIGFRARAIEFTKDALMIDPECYKAYCNLGYIYSEKGDQVKAIEFFRKAISIREEDYEARYCLAGLYIKNGKYKEALDEYNAAFKLGLDSYEFYNKIGFAYIKNHKFHEAEEAFRHSLALKKDQSEPRNNLGNLYSVFGYFKLAIEEYRGALSIEPDNKGMYDNIIKTKKEWKQRLISINFNKFQ